MAVLAIRPPSPRAAARRTRPAPSTSRSATSTIACRAEVAEGIRIGIGIHAGPVVIGRIGDSATAALTVVGSTVNEASRLEALTKDKDCQLIVSRTVAELAGIDLPGAGRETVEVRGSASKIDIVVIKSARDLPLIVTSDASKQRSTG
jgi:class 3 adenylate cyclase